MKVVATCIALLSLLLCPTAVAQESPSPGLQGALSSILSLSSTEDAKAFEVIRQCDAVAARTLSGLLIAAARKSSDAGDLARSIFLYRSAAEAARLSTNEELLAEAEYRLGTACLHANNYPCAEESLLEGLRLSEKNNRNIGVINNLGTLGVLYIRLSNYGEAERFTKQALARITASPNRASVQLQYGEAVASSNLGTIAAWNGEHAIALQYLGRAFELFEQLNKKMGGYESSALDNLIRIGEVHYNLGEYREALVEYSKVILAAEEHGFTKLLHSVLNDLGIMYMDQADYVKATELFSRSINIASKIPDNEAVAVATCNLGVASERQGMLDLAQKHFAESLRLATSGKMRNLTIPALEGLATIYRRRSQYKLALEHYDQALQIAMELGDRLRQSELFWWKAGVRHDLRDYGKSIELSEQARNLAEEIHMPDYSFLALALIGKNYLIIGQYESARSALAQAIEKAEEIRNRVGGQEMQRAHFFERKIEPYYLMVDLLIRQNKPEDALEFAERARSRALLDLTGNTKIDIAKVMSSAEKVEEQKLDAQLIALNTRLYREHQQASPSQNRGYELKSRLEKARVDYDSFMDRLFVTHPELGIDRGKAAPFSIRDAKMVLPTKDAAVVEFEVLDDKVHVFVITLGNEGNVLVRTYPIAVTKKILTEKVDHLRERIASDSLGIDRLSAELFQLLLGSAAPMLKGKRTVILVPDDVLWDLPFQALKNSTGHYLIEDHALFYAPSLTALREMKRGESVLAAGNGMQRAGGSPNPDFALTLLAFGDPAFSSKTFKSLRTIVRDEELAPLPTARKEVQTLGTLYGSSRSAVFVGTEATEDRAKAEMERFRILHFATHGILDGMNPLFSHVVLSQSGSGSGEDGILEAREIMKMNLKADIAILSACQTGRGRISRGEGVIGMSWALFAAGCPTGVVSQWNVESYSTTQLMIDFHKALLTINKGADHIRGSAEALRQAALKMLKTPGFTHPLFWAGFIVVGNGG